MISGFQLVAMPLLLRRLVLFIAFITRCATAWRLHQHGPLEVNFILPHGERRSGGRFSPFLQKSTLSLECDNLPLITILGLENDSASLLRFCSG
jgi:hypothetical protein